PGDLQARLKPDACHHERREDRKAARQGNIAFMPLSRIGRIDKLYFTGDLPGGQDQEDTKRKRIEHMRVQIVRHGPPSPCSSSLDGKFSRRTGNAAARENVDAVSRVAYAHPPTEGVELSGRSVLPGPRRVQLT